MIRIESEEITFCEQEVDVKMKRSLCELRNTKGKTQRQVAQDNGIALSTVAMYEIGARTPSLKNAKKLASYFGVKVEDIFFGPSAHEMRANGKRKGRKWGA